jgi:drug/metabolite transporter (DMT)-like permease
MWIILAFLSAALLGCYDFFKKQSLKGNAVIPVLFLNTIICSLFFVPLIFGSSIGCIAESQQLFVPCENWEAHSFIFLKAIIVLSSWLCGYFAIKHLPLTIAGPINATRPVITLLGALFIYGEQLNFWQWAGVILTIISFFLLSKSGKKEGIHFLHNKWIFFLVAAALLGSASGLYDKYLMAPQEEGGLGLNRMFVQGWYNLYQAAMMAIVFLTLWFPKRKSTTPFKWRNEILLISLFLTAADMAYFYALSEPDAMISIVSMVRRGSVIVSFLFGALLLHEKNLKAKAFDLLLVLLGMICLFIGTSKF